jgi:tyrosinase
MISRRGFMKSTAVLAGAASLPFGLARAQAPARYRRLNVTNLKIGRVLDSYRKAIKAMLALPPTDPRNWYRHALVHTLDCPHGNWWFLVWHRGYVGWFEKICRELSGDPEFALPYWDWSQVPRIPTVMFDGVLNPNDPAYIASFDLFKARFQPAVGAMWKGFSGDQFNQLLTRGMRFPDDLWFDTGGSPYTTPMFFPRGQARAITAANPDLDPNTTKAVSKQRILDALAPRDFTTFGSTKARFHSTLIGFGVLEAFPHNQVHNDIAGFMQDNLSPVDPIFFLHHSNIDRLWDVWTRKQQGLGAMGNPQNYPTTPVGDDLKLWSQEPFLFFSDEKARPVAKSSAADYIRIGAFDYDYEPGTGEELVPPAGATAPEEPKKLFARITVDLPPQAHDQQLKIVVNGPEDASSVDASSPFHAGVFSMFGQHVMHCPVTITVPLSAPIAALRSSGALREDQPLNIRVVPEPKPLRPGTVMLRHGPPGPPPEVTSIVIEAH